MLNTKKTANEKGFLFYFIFVFQEKEAMEAAVRAFEDWEFRVLEQESGVDEEDNDTSEKLQDGESEEMEKEISCQQHSVNTAQVNKAPRGGTLYSCFLRLSTGFCSLLMLHIYFHRKPFLVQTCDVRLVHGQNNS